MRLLKSTLEVLQIFLIGFWSFIGVSKLIDHQTFYRQLYAEGMSEASASVLSYLIPMTAILAAAVMIFSKFKKVGLALSSLLLVTFTIYIFYIINFVSPPPCSCIALTSKLNWNQHFYISFILLLLNIFLLVQRTNEEAQDTERILS